MYEYDYMPEDASMGYGCAGYDDGWTDSDDDNWGDRRQQDEEMI